MESEHQLSKLREECCETDVTIIKKALDECISGRIHSKNVLYTVEQIITAYLKCSALTSHNCNIMKWASFELFFEAFVKFVIHYVDKKDACRNQIASKEYKKCIQGLITLVPRLDEVDDVETLLMTVLKCLQSVLSKCPVNVPTSIITMEILITSSRKVIVEPLPIPQIWATISSVKVGEDSIDVCENIFRNEPDESYSRPDFEPECIPVSIVKKQSTKIVVHILVQTCVEGDVDEWLEKVKICLELKVTKVGLQNPDYLTIDRTITILKECIRKKKPIQCVPKFQRDFRMLIKSLLEFVKYNALSSEKEKCRDELKVETLYICMNLLQKYLALTYDPEQFTKNKEKALNCVCKAMKRCASKLRNDMIDALDLAIVKGTKNLEVYGRECFKECNPNQYMQSDKAMEFYNTPSYITCGPGSRAQNNQVLSY